MHPQSGHRRASRRNPSPDVATLSPICRSKRPQPIEHAARPCRRLAKCVREGVSKESDVAAPLRPLEVRERVANWAGIISVALIKSGRGTWPIDSAATCFGKVRTPRR
jgi:hypothetical protein